MINSILELNEALATTHCLQIMGRVKDDKQLECFTLVDATESMRLLRDSAGEHYLYNLSDSIIFKIIIVDNL